MQFILCYSIQEVNEILAFWVFLEFLRDILGIAIYEHFGSNKIYYIKYELHMPYIHVKPSLVDEHLNELLPRISFSILPPTSTIIGLAFFDGDAVKSGKRRALFWKFSRFGAS